MKIIYEATVKIRIVDESINNIEDIQDKDYLDKMLEQIILKNLDDETDNTCEVVESSIQTFD